MTTFLHLYVALNASNLPALPHCTSPVVQDVNPNKDLLPSLLRRRLINPVIPSLQELHPKDSTTGNNRRILTWPADAGVTNHNRLDFY